MKQLGIDTTKNTAKELRKQYKNGKKPRVQRKPLGIKMMVTNSNQEKGDSTGTKKD